jgi:hypothetical protein
LINSQSALDSSNLYPPLKPSVDYTRYYNRFQNFYAETPEDSVEYKIHNIPFGHADDLSTNAQVLFIRTDSDSVLESVHIGVYDQGDELVMNMIQQ